MATSGVSAFVLASVSLAGWATSTTGMDHWTYRGGDETLMAAPRVPRGDLSRPAWIEMLKEGEARWWQSRDEVIQRTKDICARETGDSPVPGHWFGYSRAFRDCMMGRGWAWGRSPL